MTHGRTKIIACRTVIEEMRELLPSGMEPLTLESGLHLHPDKLRDALQAMIDEITAHTETIILGYGLCSMGVIGLKATDSTLVIPRQDDCIAIFLGSRRAYRKALSEEPGTYFLSKGWIDAGITLVDELKRMEERYGKRRAELVMKRMLRHYRRLAFIDMGYQDQERYRQFSRRAAKEFNLSESLEIPPEDVIIDCLALTVGADSNTGLVTLEAIRRVKEELGVNQTLGASNISFGLPDRNLVNHAFLAMAISSGVTCPTVDAAKVHPAVLSIDLILGRDRFAQRYMRDFRQRKSQK